MIKYILIYTLIMVFIYLLFLSCNISPVDYKKHYALDFIEEEYSLKYKIGNKEEILKYGKTIKYPIILKPNWCSTTGINVHKIDSFEELELKVNNFPHNEIMIQEYDDSPYEGSILYERWPFCEKGRIISIIKKVLFKKDTIEHNLQTSKIHNITHLNTKKLEEIVNNLSKKIPGFYIGRYDIKFKSEDDLKNGKFKIMELNGSIALDLSSYTDTKKNFHYKTVLKQSRWLFKRILVGLINILNPCNWLESLTSRYYELTDMIICPSYRKKIPLYCLVGILMGIPILLILYKLKV